MNFSTKAGTLYNLQYKLKSAKIANVEKFTVREWTICKDLVLEKIFKNLGDVPLIVRSSCRREDGVEKSYAGAFLTIQNVHHDELNHAITRVIKSYETPQEFDEVLVQPMLTNIVASGVAFSHDPNTRSPYRIINWADGSDTTVVTSGHGGRTWTHAVDSPVQPPRFLSSVVTMIDELWELFCQPIDCEFAVTIDENDNETIWLLQVRRLIIEPKGADSQTRLLKKIEEKIERGMHPHPFILGKRTVYGVMPDWNPAEIIGIRPKPLSLSLYRELFTDSIWAYQRHNYGYRNLRSFPLMPHFFGLPYIDVRVSFNSFIPADLDRDLATRLVDYYITRLLDDPTLHDKVEFDIVFSCYTLDLPQRLKILDKSGFTQEDQKTIADSLLKLTNKIIHPKDGLLREDALKLDLLTSRREELLSSSDDPIERIYWLLEDGKRYGTLPFAGLARAGFIAVQILKSLVSVGILSDTDYYSFMRSITTIRGQMVRDRAMLDRPTFLSRYGHLRPGTYDILSPRYDEAPDLYFDWSRRPQPPEPVKPFSITLPQMRSLSDLLEQHGIISDPVGLFDFLQKGIEYRELSKFYFTRNLSDILSLIGDYGKQRGVDKDDMAYCDISVFKELYVAAAETREVLRKSIELGKKRYRETLSLSLPPLIASPNDVWSFELPTSVPNFITQEQITAPVVGHESLKELCGSIVCIPNADPGFDWLFDYQIGGLITAWGGANSHMAIRAGEMNLPSVIGSGELLYRRWSKSKRLHIDCAGKRVEVLE